MVSIRFALLFLCLISIAHTTIAAEPSPATSQPSTSPTTRPSSRPSLKAAALEEEPAPHAPFAPAEAATNAESVSLTLRTIQTDLNDDRALGVIQAELPILTDEIIARQDETTKLISSSPSLQLLSTQEQDWNSITANLDDWKHDLAKRVEQLEKHHEVVSAIRVDWIAEGDLVWFLRTHNREMNVVKIAHIPVDDTLHFIDATLRNIEHTEDRVTDLLQAVDQQDAKVREILNSVQSARNDAFNRLTVRNDAVLWNMPGNMQKNLGFFQQSQDSFTRQFQAVIAYIQRRRENVGFQLVILVFLSAGLYWIRKRIRQWSEQDPALQRATLVFASPIATALVLSFLISIWVYPQAPRLFWAMIGAAALIPTVVILRRLIDQRLFPILSALVVFYFLDQIRAISAVVPVMARVLLTIEMFCGFLLLVSFIRSTRDEQPADGRVWKVIRLVRWVWTGVFLVGFITAVIGFTSLANLLGDTALSSVYLAVILYAATLIIGALALIALRSRPLSLLEMVRRHQPLLLRRLTLALEWSAIAAWLLGVLASLSIASSVYWFVHRILFAQLDYGQLQLSLGNLLEFLLTVWGAVLISRFVRFALVEDVYERFQLPGGIPYAISKVVNYIILLLGFFLGLSKIGVDLNKFTVLAGAFGVGLGFGLQNIFNNFVSGIILLFERPVKVGDVIQMDDTTGVVKHIGIRASIITTQECAEIIVPNGNLISNKVVNWTLSNRERGIAIQVALGADAEPAVVIDTLKAVAAAHRLVLIHPEPQAYLMKLGGDSFSYELRVWTNNADQWVEIRSELSVAIHDAMMARGIPIK